jgi:hypothetical protein
LHDGETNMAKPKYRKRVSKTPRKNQDHKGLPQMIVALSALPEFGGRACSLTMAYKFCAGQVVSARLVEVKKEAERRLAKEQRRAEKERAA